MQSKTFRSTSMNLQPLVEECFCHDTFISKVNVLHFSNSNNLRIYELSIETFGSYLIWPSSKYSFDFRVSLMAVKAFFNDKFISCNRLFTKFYFQIICRRKMDFEKQGDLKHFSNVRCGIVFPPCSSDTFCDLTP